MSARQATIAGALALLGLLVWLSRKPAAEPQPLPEVRGEAGPAGEAAPAVPLKLTGEQGRKVHGQNTPGPGGPIAVPGPPEAPASAAGAGVAVKA